MQLARSSLIFLGAVAVVALGLLGWGCGSPREPLASVDCSTSHVVPGVHENEAGLARALAESDRQLCDALKRNPNGELRLVVSFQRLLTDDELLALIDRLGLEPFFIDARSGDSRNQFQVGDDFQEALAENTHKQAKAIEGLLRMIELLKNEYANDPAEMVSVNEKDATLRQALSEGPRYLGVGARVRGLSVNRIFADADVRYVVLADLMVYPKGIDPQTGEWE